MQPLSVVIAQPDLRTASQLAASMRTRFRNVAVTQEKENLRAEILKSRAALAVVDLELLPLPEVKELCRELNNVRVVCTHRIADEKLWAAVLGAGAEDCCTAGDIPGIISAAERSLIPRALAKAKAA
ncbi:MAG TPA: hypothetical protein VKW78_04380 [Terriglobales bacterium]|nr:hypothetical protein [Terriglobales bacterium]